MSKDEFEPEEELQDFPPLHSHIGDGKFHVDCDACSIAFDPIPEPETEFISDMGVEKRAEIQRWADKAMFKAEEIDASAGPKVYLLWMTPDPLGAIAAACKMYKGEVVRDLSTITDGERLEYFEQVQRTKLKAPFEFVKFHFLIEGVTRAFTHQMVRQRTAAYAQESLRFAVKEDMPVGLPPSLAGTEDYWAAGDMPSVPETNEEHMRAIWENAKEYNQNVYNELVNMGMPAEDARGMLPHNVLTRLHYTTDLRALLDHAGNRLCTQAQFEWRLVFAKIIEAIRETDVQNHFRVGPGEFLRAEMANGKDCVYMADKLLSAFKPVCFQTGKCEFKANFDRHCKIRERVDAFEKHGVPSSEWERGKDFGPESRNVGWRSTRDLLPWTDRQTGHEIIPGIKPGEWLLDPGAARKK
jgi:flavin-dependent thymidylate synthase